MKNVTVEEIHKEFNSAGENLVKQANAIVAKGLLDDNSNARKLNDLGFTQCKEVVILKRLESIKRDADLAESYQIKYPQYKFITKDIIDKLCKKYKLLFGVVERYKNRIPLKNINDILSFNVKDEDCNEKNNGLFWPTQSMHMLNIFGYGQLESDSEKVEREKKEKEDHEKRNKKSYDRKLSICASRGMMDLRGAKIEGNEIKEIVKDPIVLHPVKGGYLIVTAWGNEASDELVVNEIMN